MENYPFIAAFNAFSALNFGALDACINIVSPVCGFLPWCPALSATSKLPNPVIIIFSPFARAAVSQADIRNPLRYLLITSLPLCGSLAGA